MSNDNTEAMQALLDDLTKPKGSLGKLEDYALRMANIQGRVPPTVRRKAIFTIAGDHGVCEEGVSLYPSEVTAQMMHNFMAGGAAINAFAGHCGYDLYAVDAGVAGDLPPWPSLDPDKPAPLAAGGAPQQSGAEKSPPGYFALKAVRGSANFSRGLALTPDQFEACLDNGRRLARFAIASGYDLVAIGDMGIGNTTSAAALLCALGLNLDEAIDRGTGIDDAMLERKRQVVAQALVKHGPFPQGPDGAIRAGRAFAGPEIATAAGLCLGLAGSQVACMIDGFPITSAACLAARLNPAVTGQLFAGHLSRVRGHRAALGLLGLDPILSLDMRLGEGTGAVLGGFLVELSCKFSAQMARFSQMGVSKAPTEEVDF